MSVHLSIAKDFSETPGPRYREEGDFSGQQFLEELLEHKFQEAAGASVNLVVDLDGTEGYATSFLEAAFGGLARKFGAEAVRKVVKYKSEDEPYLIHEIAKYIQDVEDGNK